MRRHWTAAIHSLVLVRAGQELGCDSPATKAIHDAIDLLVTIANAFIR
jgi:hypothetical protein